MAKPFDYTTNEPKECDRCGKRRTEMVVPFTRTSDARVLRCADCDENQLLAILRKDTK